MILRLWAAEMRRTEVDAYVRYFEVTGARDYGATPGNLGYQLLFEDIDAERTRVMTLSWWRSEDDIRRFAGDDVARARYYPEDDRYLLTFPQTVRHFRVPVSHRSPPAN